MWLISTTHNWNVGDDLIREGVMALMGIKADEPKLWLSRNQVRCDGPAEWQPLYRRQLRMPDLEALAPLVKGFILAGTPEWMYGLEPVWGMCLAHKVPIWMVGIGGVQGDGNGAVQAAQEAGLIRACTTRDAVPEAYLKSYGVPYKRFLDPAFHATRSNGIGIHERRPGVLFNPRLDRDSAEPIYAGIYERLKDDIVRIVVHDADEVPKAARLFGSEPFYSSDYREYANAYYGCTHYVGGRLHGAIMATREGANVHLVAHDEKHEAIRRWGPDFGFPEDMYRVYAPDDAGSIHIEDHTQEWRFAEHSATNWLLNGPLGDDFGAHFAYLKDRKHGHGG